MSDRTFDIIQTEPDCSDMKTMSMREFFRQPRRIQQLIKQGQTLLVSHRNDPVFEVRPARERKSHQARRSRGVWSHLGYSGDPTAALPPEENWQ